MIEYIILKRIGKVFNEFSEYINGVNCLVDSFLS